MPGDYPFENLGDERFQQLCQALLVRERANVQCFPVGQSDGGRDAVSYLSGGKRPFVVYQVKFSNGGLREKDPREWLRKVLVKEVPKIERLAGLGATEYVGMTNVAGTGHADSGSIDKIDALFAKSLPIPAICLWRDDLARRLDEAWNLKWAYPELMTGPDLLRAVVEAGGAEERSRRSNALKAFLASQYHSDQQVRFRQVDLESPLLDLFIDVPLSLSGYDRQLNRDRGRQLHGRLLRTLIAVAHDLEREALDPVGHEGLDSGASTLSEAIATRGKTRPLGASPPGAIRALSALGQNIPRSGDWISSFSAKVHSATMGALASASTAGEGQVALWDDEDGDILVAHDTRVLVERASEVGAAAFLAHPFAAQQLPFIVLEGAPGQGKSTVTQFLCQVHRMRLLDKRKELSALASPNRPRGARLPIRADLRDFAAWMGGRNPFVLSSAPEAQVQPEHWKPSLEAFLAALISHQSGGTHFNVADLQEVARVSSMLIVLDGLDEVADAKRRTSVVDAIRDGTRRLAEVAAAIQVIVTSRPAAFATTPGLPEDEFPRLQLGPVTGALALSYADRWLRARQVDPHEAATFRDALAAKLELPHLSELARNPMQLAILLSLFNTRGVSLPDKRTALYTSYIEVFFGREAEKSAVVRDHRDLLLSLHGFLAWLLHSEAETTQGDERGRITQDRLRKEVRGYLESEGHDAGLVESLFSGVIDRIVALVSRVQGTYEFEVQPLREYFAGRFLYQTAKYSRAGDERHGGTKPDRFDQIARSPYWLNVTRFFAGFFDKGELPMLVDRLKELADDPKYRLTSHPATVAATLLSDWVFAQTPRTVAQVTNIILEPPRLKTLLSGMGSRGAAGDPLSLSTECGRPQLVERVFELLENDPRWDYQSELVGLVMANTSVDERVARWRKAAAAKGASRASRYAWLSLASSLQILAVIPLDELLDFLRDPPPWVAEAWLLHRAGRSDAIAASRDVAQAALDGILEGRHAGMRNREPRTLLDALARLMGPSWHHYEAFQGQRAFAEIVEIDAVWPGVGTLKDTLSQFDSGGIPEDLAERSRRVLTRVAHASVKPTTEWPSRLFPLEEAVEAAREEFGESWGVFELATKVAMMSRSGREGGTKGRETTEMSLVDHGLPLVPRIWIARMRAKDAAWWERQFAAAASDFDRSLVVTLFCAWASAKVVGANAAALDDAVRLVAQPWWGRVVALVTRLGDATRKSRRVRRPSLESDEKAEETEEEQIGAARILTEIPRSDLDNKTLALLRHRLSSDVRRRVFDERLQGYRGTDYSILRWAQEEALLVLSEAPEEWDSPLRTISAGYAHGGYLGVDDPAELRAYFDSSSGGNAAEEVLSNPGQYPQVVIAAAERRMRKDLAARLRPVAVAAEEDGWFSA